MIDNVGINVFSFNKCLPGAQQGIGTNHTDESDICSSGGIALQTPIENHLNDLDSLDIAFGFNSTLPDPLDTAINEIVDNLFNGNHFNPKIFEGLPPPVAGNA